MLELKTLRYFFTYVAEGSLANAAKVLHITEPTLSRQLNDLEKRIGHELYHRVNRRIVLTQKGEALFNYAESIIKLADQAEAELIDENARVRGSVYVGGGSTIGMDIIAEAIDIMRQSHPEILTEFFYAASNDQIDPLSKGLLDFVVETEITSRPGFEMLEFPIPDQWVVFMRKSDPLARKRAIKPQDLVGKNVIVPRHAMQTLFMRNVIDEEGGDTITPLPVSGSGPLSDWFGDALDKINVVATQNISLYGMFFVKRGLAYSFAHKGLYEIDGLVHRPLKPALFSANGLLWPKTRPHSEQATIFLECVREACRNHAGETSD